MQDYKARGSHLPKFFVVGIVALAVVVLLIMRPQQEVVMKQAVVQVVEAYQVSRQDVRPVDSVVGRLEPVRKTALHFEVDGIVVNKAVKPGQRVMQGQLLLELDDADLRDRLIEAESLLEQEEAAQKRDQKLLELAIKNVGLAANEVKRMENLGKKSLASQSVLDDARRQLALLQSEKASLQYAINTAEQRYRSRQSQKDQAERNLKRARLIAPYDGRVNAIYNEIGDRVTPGTKALDFIDDATFEIRLHVSRQAVTELVEGMPIDIHVEGRVFQGSIVEFQRDPDPQTFTYEARIEMADQGFLSGALARVELPLKPALGALVVPLSAVLQDDGETSVFVIKNNVLEKRPVMTGRRYKSLQIITHGLQQGEQIVARDISALADQQQVVVQ